MALDIRLGKRERKEREKGKTEGERREREVKLTIRAVIGSTDEVGEGSMVSHHLNMRCQGRV